MDKKRAETKMKQKGDENETKKRQQFTVRETYKL